MPNIGGQSHLDLIKAGGFKLKKVDPNAPKPEKKALPEKDADSLTVGELLEKMAQIRTNTQPESSDEESSSSSSSEDW